MFSIYKPPVVFVTVYDDIFGIKAATIIGVVLPLAIALNV